MDSNNIKKNAIIYVFTGTGNTLIAAHHVAKNLEDLGIHTIVYQLRENEDENLPDPNNYDISGFAYPIHAFNSPRYFLNKIKKLPELNEKNKKAFIFKTSGEPFALNNASSYILFKILKKKGFEPGLDMHMLMPYNIMFRYPDAMAKQMYLHTTKVMAPHLADAVAYGRFKKLRYNPFLICFTYIMRLQWLGALINGPLHKIDKNKCVKCLKCEKKCPAANISSGNNGYPSIGKKCIMCMNCSMNCPKAAISPGFLTPWKINPGWDFDRILSDENIPSNWTDNENAGYFRLFRKYYSKNR